MQTEEDDQRTGNYNRNMDLMDPMNVKNMKIKCNLSDFASFMKLHSKIPTGEKSNKCSHCDYASSQAGSLRTHMKTHTGEKSNKCNHCDYASSQAGNLRTHMKTHNRNHF